MVWLACLLACLSWRVTETARTDREGEKLYSPPSRPTPYCTTPNADGDCTVVSPRTLAIWRAPPSIRRTAVRSSGRGIAVVAARGGRVTSRRPGGATTRRRRVRGRHVPRARCACILSRVRVPFLSLDLCPSHFRYLLGATSVAYILDTGGDRGREREGGGGIDPCWTVPCKCSAV